MLDGGDAFGLERIDRLGDLVAELDAADALIAPLDAGRLALDFDLEPDAADAGRLHRKPAGLAGNAGVRLVAADDRIEGAMAADLLIDDDVDAARRP